MRILLRRVCRAAILAVACSCSAEAHADTPPNKWEAIQHPERARDWKRHVQVRKGLLEAFERPRRDAERQEILRRLSLALEQAGARHSESAVLRFDLGEIYSELLAGRE